MPEFAPGGAKTAIATITVRPSGLSCSAELYLVSNGAKVATSGIKPFTSTGARQNISLPVSMPGVEGTYPVYLDVFADDMLIGAYQATEDVIITAPARFEYVSGLRTSSFQVPTIWGMKTALRYEVDIQNQGSGAGVCSVMFQEKMWEPGFPLPPDPLDPANDDNPHWGSWANFDFTQKHYVNPNWTGGRTDDFTSVVEAELAPGEIRTFWDSNVLTPYTYKDRVVGVEAAAELGEILVMR